MIIRKITLTNFRQFKGEQTIEFSTDKEKNVSVVLGINTSGKTTIVTAFNWCLYEDRSGFKQKSLLNKELESTLHGPFSTQEVSVEIVLSHQGRDYFIKRRLKYGNSSSGDSIREQKPELFVSYKEPNGETQSVDPVDCQDVINSILPRGLSGYFFFDGERIKEINNRGNVVSAVRGLMGLEVLSSGKDHLDPSKNSSVIAKFTKELDTGKDVEAGRLKSMIVEAQEDYERREKRKAEIEMEIGVYKEKKERLGKILQENQEVGQNQELKLKIEQEIVYYTNQIRASEDRLLLDFKLNAVQFFSLPLIKKVMEVIDSAKADGVGIPEMHSKSIDYIIKRGYCLCGTDLKSNQGALDKVLHERELLPPQHIGTIIRTYKESLANAPNLADSYHAKIEKDYASWLDAQKQLERKKKEHDAVSEKIKGCANVKKIEEDYQEAHRKLAQNEETLIRIREAMSGLKAKMEIYQKDLDKLLITSDKNIKIKKYIAYATEVYHWFKTAYDKEENQVREELLKSVNDNFIQMYHGSRTIVMDENYKLTPVSTGGNQWSLERSEGLETVTNFSFIMGLVELARRKVEEAEKEGNKMVNTEPYPIVMDAPFSNTDEVHIKNITKRLPLIAEQVIIIIMEKDWNYAKEELKHRVGVKCRIEKVDNKETYSVVRRDV